MGITINHRLVSDRLAHLATVAPEASARAVRREAEEIMADSKSLFVPVDQGTLAGSGGVAMTTTGDDVEATLSYGGSATDYAVVVHEHPSQYDPPSWVAAGKVTFSPAGRGPKFLERPFMAATVGMLERLSASIAKYARLW